MVASKTKKPKVLTVGQLLYICQQFKGVSKNAPVYMTDYDGNTIWPCLKTTKMYDGKAKGTQKPIELIIFADVDEEEMAAQDDEEGLARAAEEDDECSDVCDITGRMSPSDRQALAEHIKKQMSQDCVADDLEGNRAIIYAGVKNDSSRQNN